MARSLTQAVMVVALWSCAAQLVACRQVPRPDQITLYLERSAPRQLAPRELRFDPEDNLGAARLDGRGRLVVERKDGARALTVSGQDLCPTRVEPGPAAAPLPLRPALELGGDRYAVGYDTSVRVQARHNCAPHGRGSVSWRQLEGPPLGELQTSDAGFVLSVRTPSFAQLHPEPLAPGVVPISARAQGRIVLEARWQGPGAAPSARRVTITAAPRATGLSSVAVSQQLLLAGSGWRVQNRPPGGHAEVTPYGAASVHGNELLSAFAPDAPGRWLLASGANTLQLSALTHDLTPYDCGRSECHAQIAALTAPTAMSHALESQLERGGAAAASCLLGCHVVGERGLNDGGFVAVSQQLGFVWTPHTRWADLPEALRRLGGVRCTACHGPGAIPPAGARSALLRSDVCATCHDDPPRYVHVAQWRSSRMATADRAAAARAAPCARCHTTAGFLAHNGARQQPAEPETQPLGISCAACHAPHAAGRGPRLIRSASAQASWAEEPRTKLCLACHGPAPQAPGAAAPSGTLWSGEVQLPALDGTGWQPLRSRAVHRLPGGCVGCHGGAALSSGGLDHSFRADARVCASCHFRDAFALGRRGGDQLTARAARLARALQARCGLALASESPHTTAAVGCGTQALRRAQYALGLVLEDPAAAFHNAALSRALLAEAERLSEM